MECAHLRTHDAHRKDHETIAFVATAPGIDRLGVVAKAHVFVLWINRTFACFFHILSHILAISNFDLYSITYRIGFDHLTS